MSPKDNDRNQLDLNFCLAIFDQKHHFGQTILTTKFHSAIFPHFLMFYRVFTLCLSYLLTFDPAPVKTIEHGAHSSLHVFTALLHESRAL
jgi:hypothetical protein